MGIKSKQLENVELITNDKIKAKRGRKSKKELLTALNVESLVKIIDTKKINQPPNTINLNIAEIVSKNKKKSNIIYHPSLEIEDTKEIEEIEDTKEIEEIEETKEIEEIEEIEETKEIEDTKEAPVLK